MEKLKVIVIGAVNSTKMLLEEMLNCNIEIAMVFSLDEKVSENVSGYYPLHEFAEQNGISYKKYIKINDEINIQIMEEIKPEYIFAIGFSQLISKKILDIPKFGVIGCHPSDLPRYRGRAVIVWQMLLGVKESKVTMFMIDEGIDSGDIIDQEPYHIGEDDYAYDVLEKSHAALRKLYQRVLPAIADGTYILRKQEEFQATYCLKRTPEDGIIDWSSSGRKILRLIRAVSKPYPGAFTFYDGKDKLVCWKAHLEENKKYYGFPGQIAYIKENNIGIILNDRLLVIEEYENINKVKIFVGHRLGDKK